MSDACPHGDIRAACLECLDGPLPAPKRVRPRADTPPFTARYDGRCSECDERWEAGDRDIVRLTDGTYACASCSEPMR